ncbi:hypothetical protein ACTFIV_000869 [Dictyostelium citrinum]
MLGSISQNDNICSSYQFGESFDYEDQGRSNFIKLKIGKFSLRGKYNKRAVIDSRIVTIKNEILNDLDSLNQQNQQQANSAQSYIDHDESNLDSPNSICNNSNDSGLT